VRRVACGNMGEMDCRGFTKCVVFTGILSVQVCYMREEQFTLDLSVIAIWVYSTIKSAAFEVLSEGCLLKTCH